MTYYDLSLHTFTVREPANQVTVQVRGRITVKVIQDAVADYYGIPRFEMTSARRGRDEARPRQVAMYLCKQLTGKSLPQMAKLFGGRDHTTILHGIRTIERLRYNPPPVRVNAKYPDRIDIDQSLDRDIRALTDIICPPVEMAA